MERGDELSERGDLSGALEAYRGADEIMLVPTTGLARAKTLMALGRLVEASDVLLRVGRSEPREDEDPVITEARSRAATLATELAPRIPSVTLDIRGVDSGAQPSAKVDGVDIPAAALGLPRKVDPGTHTVSVAAPGYVAAERSVTVAEAEHATLPIELVEDPNAVAPPPVSDAPPPPVTAPPPPPAESSSGVPPLAWTGFAVGVVGIGVGTVAGIMSLSRASDADAFCDGDTCTPEARDDIDASLALANVSNVGFGVGLVGIVVGVIALATAGDGDHATSRHERGIRVDVGRSGATLSARY